MMRNVSTGISGTRSADGYVATMLTSPERLQEAAELYRTVFGYNDPAHGVNPKLLAALAANGGSVVGVIDPGGRLVGFAYGFPGIDEDGYPYHYSQAAVVEPAAQGQGVGRMLKREQAAIAQARGAHAMRWAFDPSIARNAHFNLDVLGGTARWFHPDFYGPDSDRLVVEWRICGSSAGAGHADPPPPQIEVSGAQWGAPRVIDGVTYLPLPARIDELRRAEPERASAVRRALGGSIAELVQDDYVAVSCRRIDELTSAYRFAPSRRR
ncbi:MAG: GNAT family N-acetyltransferase [Cellulomonadaceae bacterium]